MKTRIIKKLKKNGFPYDWCHDIDMKQKECIKYHSPDKNDLIKVLGKDLDHTEYVEFDNYKWFRAYMTEDKFNELGIGCVRDCCGYEAGDTEEEALANLWLYINELKNEL